MPIRCGLILGSLLAAVLLAGCGDDDGDRASTPATSPTTAASAVSPEALPGGCCRRLALTAGSAPATAAPLARTQARPRGATSPAPEGRIAGGRVRRCGNVIFQPRSDNGAFDVATVNVICPAARRLLRSRGGLRSWRCGIVDRARAAERWLCVRDRRAIAFTLY